MNSSGPINTTNGSNAIGIFADSGSLFTGPQPATVQVNATNVLTMGQFGTAISATAGGDVTVNVAPGGSVMGGWQADLTSVGPTAWSTGRRRYPGSTGGTATLTNDGSIGALSDRAVAGDPLPATTPASSTTAPSPASCNSPAAITASSTMARST